MFGQYEDIPLKVTEENREEIQLAQAVLRAVSGMQYSMVAGGAVRDWYLGRTCNDVDIFIPNRMKKGTDPYDTLCSTLVTLLDIQFEEIGDHEKYADADGEWMVLQFHFKGTKFQLIIGQDPFVAFPYDISNFFMGADGGCSASRLAVQGFKTKQFKGDDSKYIKKMQEHYPDVKFLSPKDAELYVHLSNKLEEPERPEETTPTATPTDPRYHVPEEARTRDPFEEWERAINRVRERDEELRRAREAQAQIEQRENRRLFGFLRGGPYG